MTADERFDAKVVPEPMSGCFIWSGATRFKDGYGSFGPVANVIVLAHHFAYRRAHGPIPRGMVVHHKCRNRACVNPDHLVAITQRENLLYRNESYAPGPRRIRPNREQRLLAKFKQVDGECWPWLAAKANGYGRFGKKELAYRAVYELFVGTVPEGKYLDHLCRNRACVNPAHLEPVTMRENVLRGIGFSALNSKKTHCPRGHPLTGDNVYHRKDRTGRMCRECQRQRRANLQQEAS